LRTEGQQILGASVQNLVATVTWRLGAWGLGSRALDYILIVCFRTDLDQNDLYYSMKKAERGRAIIFNHEFFEKIEGDSAEPRHGTVMDVERLCCTFSDLGFMIDLQENRTYKQIMDHISQGISVTTYLSFMTEIYSAWNFSILGREARCSY
jgi:hypothetical protein